MSTLTAEDIVVRRGGRTILASVSLSAGPGEFLSIAGPNGSGKSSLLRALAGIWPVTAGAVKIDAKHIGGLSRRDVARLLAFVPQDTRMDFAFSVAEVVAMGRYARRGRFERAAKADRAAIYNALLQCDITHLTHRFVTTLSGGERQRVAIARSLAGEPQIILLDEPTSSLDVEHSVEVLELCRSLAREGKTVVLATHDLNMVARYTSHVALLDAGRIAYAGERDGALSSHVLEKVFHVETELLQSAAGHPVFVFHSKRETGDSTET